MGQTEEERKVGEKRKNVGNERGNVYVYIPLSNARFSLMCYVDRNILTSLPHDRLALPSWTN